MDKSRESIPTETALVGGHVFRMSSVHDVFRKLGREKRRFENAEETDAGRGDRIDAILNFAITAWHMTDWVWKRHEQIIRERFSVAGLEEFQKAMIRCCSELAACDVLANAAKHGGVAHARAHRPNVETVLLASRETEPSTGYRRSVSRDSHSG